MRDRGLATRAAPSRLQLAVLAVFLLVVAGSASAQAPEQQERPGFGANVELAMVNVAVLGPGGVPIIADFQPEDFVIEEDGVARRPGFVRAPLEAPLDIALVLDLSVSMQSHPWRQHAEEFLEALDPTKDCVYMLGFSESIGRSIWARPNDPFLAGSIERTMGGGGTSLFDATLVAIREMSFAAGSQMAELYNRFAASAGLDRTTLSTVIRRPGGCPVPPDPAGVADPSTRRRQAIVVVTDGEDSTSTTSVYEIGLATQATGLPVFRMRFHTEELDAPAGISDLSRRDDRGRRAARLFQSRAEDARWFSQFVTESGGKEVPPSDGAFAELLDHLRGFYVVGYYVPRAGPGIVAELTRHQLDIRMPTIDADLFHPELTYRATVDIVGARAELAASRNLLEAGDLTGALLVIDNAVAADARSAQAWQQRARVMEQLGRDTEAMLDAQRAAELAPEAADIQQLAARLSLARGMPQAAWEHAIRAAQGGVDTRTEIEQLSAIAPPPDNLDDRLRAPSVAVVPAPSNQSDLLARAALPRALLALRRSIAAAPSLALVADPSRADYVIEVADESVDEAPPRRFTARLTMFHGDDELHDERFALDDLDRATSNAADLRELVTRVQQVVARTGDQ